MNKRQNYSRKREAILDTLRSTKTYFSQRKIAIPALGKLVLYLVGMVLGYIERPDSLAKRYKAKN